MPAPTGLRADRTLGMMVLAFLPMTRAIRYLPFSPKPDKLPASLDYLFGPVSVSFWGYLWFLCAALIVTASALYRRRFSAIAIAVLSFLCIIWSLSMFASQMFFQEDVWVTATGYAVTGIVLAAWMRVVIPPKTTPTAGGSRA